MTHRGIVVEALATVGPLSDYSIAHYARVKGVKASPSSIRTRRRELQRDGLVRDSGRTERTPSGRRAVVWQIA